MLAGCVQPSLDPDINEATQRLLTRLGAEVVVAQGAGCCGALTHHLGDADKARQQARANVKAWWALHQEDPLDAVVITASGCGTTVKDYGHLLADDPQWAEPAAALAALAWAAERGNTSAGDVRQSPRPRDGGHLSCGLFLAARAESPSVATGLAAPGGL
jgi:Fe-S oxidoreductase